MTWEQTVEITGALENRCVLEGSEERRAVETLQEQAATEQKGSMDRAVCWRLRTKGLRARKAGSSVSGSFWVQGVEKH